MQFLVTAQDGTDEGALERRMNARPRHLENIKKVKEKGSVLCAGGITGPEGHVRGSFLVMEFETRTLLDYDFRAFTLPTWQARQLLLAVEDQLMEQGVPKR